MLFEPLFPVGCRLTRHSQGLILVYRPDLTAVLGDGVESHAVQGTIRADQLVGI